MLDGRQVRLVEPAAPDDVVADHPYAAFADGAESEFALVGNAQLADHDHIERRLERSGHMEGHRDPATRQSQHDRLFSPQML